MIPYAIITVAYALGLSALGLFIATKTYRFLKKVGAIG